MAAALSLWSWISPRSGVRGVARRLVADGRSFDAVIANAGVMRTPFGHTADGFETQFGTNHLGHFVLVNRIASLIVPGGRLVNVASSGHRYSDVDLDDPNFERTPYDPMIAYGRSKTTTSCSRWSSTGDTRRRGVRAIALHPGGILTELGRHLQPGELDATVERSTPNPGRGPAALPVQDNPPGRRDLGLGRLRRPGRRGRRPLLRGPPGRRRSPKG